MSDDDFVLWFIDQENPSVEDRERMLSIARRWKERASAIESGVCIKITPTADGLKAEEVPIAGFVDLNGPSRTPWYTGEQLDSMWRQMGGTEE